MQTFFRALRRRMIPILGAGFLLQAGSCNLDANTLGQALFTRVANNLIVDFVFGAFNVQAPPGSVLGQF